MNKKWIISILVAFLLVVGLLPAGLLAAGETPDLVISNYDELASFAMQVNNGETFKGKLVQLKNNITIESGTTWDPIGRNGTTFQGTFDGNGFTINNLDIAPFEKGAPCGFFGVVSNNGTVKNLTLTNVTIENENSVSYVGAIAGQGFVAHFDNCHVKGDINITAKDRYVGGIVGHLYGSVKNCSVIGNDGSKITAKYFMGGAVGFVAEGNNVVANTTVSNIDIDASGWVGGIAGNLHYGATVSGCKVENTSIAGDYPEADDKFGLIVGQNLGKDTSVSYVTDNVATGTTAANGDTPITQLSGPASATVVGDNIETDDSGKIIGGTFYAPVPESELKENYELKSDGTVGKMPVIAKIGSTEFYQLGKALETAKSISGNVVIEIVADIDMSNHTAVNMNGGNVTTLTIDGKNHTITGLNQPLIGITMGSGTTITVKDLTFKDSNVQSVENDFIGAAVIAAETLASCRLEAINVDVIGGTITSGGYAGAFVGYAQGWDTDIDLYIKDCEVSGVTFVGKGSVGALVGHVQGGYEIIDTKVGNNTLTTLDDNSAKVGVLFGTSNTSGTKLIDVNEFEKSICKQDFNGVVTTITNNALVGRVYSKITYNGGSYITNPDTISYAGGSDLIAYAGVKVEQDGKYIVAKTQIDEVYYESIQDAINAAGNEDVIKVIYNNFDEDSIIVPADKNVVIDLNGNTLDIDIMNYGTLTVMNGTINNTNTDASAIENNGASASLTTDEVNITSARHAIRVDGGMTTVKSGMYKTLGSRESTLYAMNISTSAKVEIINGTFIAGKENSGTEGTSAIGIRGASELIIRDGNFSKSVGGNIRINEIEANCKVVIHNATFDEDPYVGDIAKIEILADKKAVKKLSDTEYTIVNGVAVNEAKSINKYYATLQDAIDAAGTDAEIKLVDEITSINENNITIPDGKSVVIDLNDKTVNGYFMVYGQATIKNGTIDSNNDTVSAIESNGAAAVVTLDGLTVTSERHAIRVDGGAVIIKSGEYVASNYASNHVVNISDGGKVTIEGGTFVGNMQSGSGSVAIRGDNSVLEISGGTFIGGSVGSLTVWAGTATVTGGTYETVYADVEVAISGGHFEKINKLTGQGVTGGTFTTKPNDAYLAKDYSAYASSNGDHYRVMMTASNSAFVRNDINAGKITVWGETRKADTTESLIIKILDEKGNCLATSELLNHDNIITGSQTMFTWSIIALGESVNDPYWKTEVLAFTPDVEPAKVVTYVDGYKVHEADVNMSAPDGVNPVVWNDLFVAQIDGVYYNSLQKAIDAAEGNEFKLLTNVKEAGIRVAAGKTAVIDFNGKTLTGDILNEGNLTVNNGTIISDSFTSAIESYGESADLTVTGMNLTSQRHALRIEGGKATINSGTFTTVGRVGQSESVHALNAGGAYETSVTINGGTFNGIRFNGNAENPDSGAAVNAQANATVVIKAGTFGYGQNNTLATSNGGTITIAPDKEDDGGTYDQDPRVSGVSLGEKKAVLTVSDTEYKVVDAVAKIDDKYYATLQEAIDASNANATIELISDLPIDTKLTFDGGYEYTLNLCGFTLTIDSDSHDGIVVSSGSTLNLENGTYTFDCASSSWDAVYVNYGTLNIKDGLTMNVSVTANSTFHAEAGKGNKSVINIYGGEIYMGGQATTSVSAIQLTGNAELYMNGGKVDIDVDFDGKYDAWNRDAVGVVIVGNNTTATLKGGSFTVNGKNSFAQGVQIATMNGKAENSYFIIDGTDFAVNNDGEAGECYPFAIYDPTQGEIEVKSGSVTGKFDGLVSVYPENENNGDVQLNVSGGEFSKPVPEEYCEDGFIPTKNDDGTYGVKEGTIVARVDGFGYATLAEAFANANKKDTITLDADVTVTESINSNSGFGLILPADVTLDLNGHTITGKLTTGTAIFDVVNGLTVKDSTTGGGGKIVAENCDIFKVQKKNLQIQAGTYEVAAGYSVIDVHNTVFVYITDGIFPQNNSDVIDMTHALSDASVMNESASIITPPKNYDWYDGVLSESKYQAQVDDGERYESLAAAFAAAGKGSTVKLIKDFTLTETVNVKLPDVSPADLIFNSSKGITFDLNGCKLIGKIADGGAMFNINCGFYVEDSSKEKNGTITAVGCDIFEVNKTILQLAAKNATYTVDDGYSVITPKTVATGKAIINIPYGTFAPTTSDTIIDMTDGEFATVMKDSSYVTTLATDPKGYKWGDDDMLHKVDTPVELIEFSGANMTLGNTLALNFRLNTADFDAKDVANDVYYMVITRTYSDDREDDVVKVMSSEWTLSGSRYQVSYSNIAAKEMIDEFTAVVYRTEDNVAISEPWNDSVRGYAMRGINASQPGEVKTVLVDMLNYGADAQKQFNYATNDLANNKMTNDDKACATSDVIIENNINKGANYRSTVLTLEENILLKMYFNGITDSTRNGMYAVLTYTDHFGTAHTIRISGEDFIKMSDTAYGVSLSTLVVADWESMVTCVMFNSDGTVYGTVTDSVESYLSRAYTATDDELYQNIAKFCYASYLCLH